MTLISRRWALLISFFEFIGHILPLHICVMFKMYAFLLFIGTKINDHLFHTILSLYFYFAHNKTYLKKHIAVTKHKLIHKLAKFINIGSTKTNKYPWHGFLSWRRSAHLTFDGAFLTGTSATWNRVAHAESAPVADQGGKPPISWSNEHPGPEHALRGPGMVLLPTGPSVIRSSNQTDPGLFLSPGPCVSWSKRYNFSVKRG